MTILKVIGNCCLVFLTIISMCVSLAFGYYHFFVNDKTVGINYIDNQLGVDLIEKVDVQFQIIKFELDENNVLTSKASFVSYYVTEDNVIRDNVIAL